MDDDRESFTSWARTAQPGLLRLAVLLTGDHHRAEDLVQEALTKVALRWRRLRSQSPDAYARQVVVRDNISWWRRHRREHVLAIEVPPVASAEPAVDRRLALARALAGLTAGQRSMLALARALAGLTAGQRSMVVLRYYDDLSERETAAMGVSPGTVKSQTHLALRRLREQAPELAELLETT